MSLFKKNENGLPTSTKGKIISGVLALGLGVMTGIMSAYEYQRGCDDTCNWVNGELENKGIPASFEVYPTLFGKELR